VASRSGPYLAFRRRLRSARLDAGLSQAQTARRLGKQQSFISKCESGERRVDVVELRRFARVYRVPFSYFFGNAPAAGTARGVAERAGAYGGEPLTPARLIALLADERASLDRRLRALPADDRFARELLAAHRDLVAGQLALAEARARGLR
jgi:transcriptional regulator with XRE-family HTH domain